jgi:hypothetical protein
VAISDLWALEMLLAAFAGGAFGAAIGALPSFSLAGLTVIVGELYRLAGRTLGVDALPVDVTGAIGFGVVLGPHVAFGGGAAALAYAAKRGYLDTDFEYHQAKEVTRGLGSDPDVLAVGGVFGIVGYWIATLSSAVSAPVDPVALGVVGSALLHRVAFGYSLLGAKPGEWFDMSGYERARDGQADALADGGRPAVEPWLPYQYRWGNVLTLGLVVGVLGAYVAYLTASAFLAFGISVVALVFLNADVAEIPVTHHISLPASTGVLALADAPAGRLTPSLVADSIPLGEALLVGAALGILGALFGEILQRILYAHAETHLDPPAASIVVTSFLIAVLAMSGVLPSSVWIPLP